MREVLPLLRRRLMSWSVLGLLAAGCGGGTSSGRSASSAQAPAPLRGGGALRVRLAPEASAQAPTGRGCSEAAVGFEMGTRGIRAPESSVLMAIRERCLIDAWPAAAIECFATMSEGELGRCAGSLPMKARDRMFAALGSGGHGADGDGDAISGELSLAISAAKIEGLRVGVAECEAFLTAVRRALVCRAMAMETRVALGAETADFWSLPSAGLPPEAQQKMALVCRKSLVALEEEIVSVGCMP
jgi:hypothetical protein